MVASAEPGGSADPPTTEAATVSAALVREIAEAVAAKLAPAAAPGPTVARLCALYGESPDATKLGAWATERGRIANYIVPVLGARDAIALTLRDIDDLRRSVEQLAPATRNRVLVRLTAILRWAAARGYLARYPLPRVKLEAENNERSTHRTHADALLIVQALRARGRHAIAALVATAFDAGLRRGEACRLRLSQLDHRDGVISLFAAETKGKQDRATPLTEWVSGLIDQVERPRGCPWVFPSGRGVPYNPRTVLRYYQEACEDAGLEAAPGERNVLHDCRAGGADQMIAAGTSVPDLMKMWGWRDYRTARRYLRRPARAVASAAAARLEAARRPPHRAPDDGVLQDVGATTPKVVEPGN
jgi:integrase